MLKNLVRGIAAFLAFTIVFGFATVFGASNVSADVKISDYIADYTEINYVSHLGNPIRLYLDGTSICVESECITDSYLAICSDVSLRVISEASGGSNLTLSPARNMQTNVYYVLCFDFAADGEEQYHDTLYVTKTEDGQIRFIKSFNYDFNVERCSEWWTDEKSLQECLAPQNDIQCDDPYVIEYAKSITEGCDTDWEKAYAIYKYVIDFAYDDVQLADDVTVYQDDALSLLRRDIAICEGLGNVFTALCRASGIPSSVCFGIGGEAYDYVHDESILTTETPNHAWACVFLGGQWYSLDPTWDISYYYEGFSYDNGGWEEAEKTFDWYLVPLEDFSMTHKICDADTVHGIETTGSCGEDATFEISRDGTLTIYGSGEIKLPSGTNGFSKVVFDVDSNITAIGDKCFIDCDLITSVILPPTVKKIGKSAFATCEDLEYIYLPEGLETISFSAFDFCDELSYVYIPDSVRRIDEFAFDDCSRLIISIPESLEGFDAIYSVKPAMVIVRGG